VLGPVGPVTGNLAGALPRSTILWAIMPESLIMSEAIVTIPLYTTIAPTKVEGLKTVFARINNPTRKFWVQINPSAWAEIQNAPEQYRAVIEAALDNAAKQILTDYIKAYTIAPSELPAHIFSAENILDRAGDNDSSWLSKEELENAWKESDTRKRIIENNKYKDNAEYRKVANLYADYILKLSGKRADIPRDKLDWILAKIEDSDLESEFGLFVSRRISQLKTKKETNKEIDLDLI
jgi:hypothetical protein